MSLSVFYEYALKDSSGSAMYSRCWAGLGAATDVTQVSLLQSGKDEEEWREKKRRVKSIVLLSPFSTKCFWPSNHTNKTCPWTHTRVCYLSFSCTLWAEEGLGVLLCVTPPVRPGEPPPPEQPRKTESQFFNGACLSFCNCSGCEYNTGRHPKVSVKCVTHVLE